MDSTLVNYTKLSPNYQERTHAIDTITIHHCAGNISITALGDLFADRNRNASSNYGIDSEGKIGLFVPESKQAWTSGNRENDNRAITIEVANNSGSPEWTISDNAYKSLINLLVDICRRNGIKELKWKDDKSLIGQVDKQNMTVHKWFQSTNCPGPYLMSKMGTIAKEVNDRMNGEKKLYRVQIGAFAVYENAVKTLEKAKAAGFSDAFITEPNTTVTPSPEPVKPDIRVGSHVKINGKAKTYDGVQLADYIYDYTFEVVEINGSRVVIAKDNVVIAAMRKSDLFLV